MHEGDRVYRIGEDQIPGRVVKVFHDRTVLVNWSGVSESKREMVQDLILGRKPPRK
jgi:hypothetical protein